MELKNIVSIETLRKLLKQGDDAVVELMVDKLNTEVEKLNLDIKNAKLSTQKWLKAVNTKAELPTTYEGNFEKGWTYLCRVLKGPEADNVYQMIPDDDGNFTSWEFYAVNADWVDPSEFQKRIGYQYDDSVSVSGRIFNLQETLQNQITENLNKHYNYVTSNNIEINKLKEKDVEIINTASKNRTDLENLIDTTDKANRKDVENKYMKKAFFELEGHVLTIKMM